MKNNKTDARSRVTQTMVKKSLLKILQDKPIKNISVAELCREAEITRGTFYNHFYDVLDVYDSIENEFFQTVAGKLDKFKTYALDYDFFLEIMKILAENSDISMFIASNPHESGMLKRLMEHVKEKYITEYSERFPSLDKSVIEAIFLFSSSGSVSVIVDWFSKGATMPIDMIARFIGAANKLCVENCDNLQRIMSSVKTD